MPKLDKNNIKRKLKIDISTKHRQKSLNKILARGIQQHIKSYLSWLNGIYFLAAKLVQYRKSINIIHLFKWLREKTYMVILIIV